MSKTGAELIAAERQRHVDEEGWTPEHDDQHSEGELAIAASVYAIVTPENVIGLTDEMLDGGGNWPWDLEWFKPFDPSFMGDVGEFPVIDRKRCLVKAGALIAAEIDRLQRLEDQHNE